MEHNFKYVSQKSQYYMNLNSFSDHFAKRFTKAPIPQ